MIGTRKHGVEIGSHPRRPRKPSQTARVGSTGSVQPRLWRDVEKPIRHQQLHRDMGTIPSLLVHIVCGRVPGGGRGTEQRLYFLAWCHPQPTSAPASQHVLFVTRPNTCDYGIVAWYVSVTIHAILCAFRSWPSDEFVVSLEWNVGIAYCIPPTSTLGAALRRVRAIAPAHVNRRDTTEQSGYSYSSPQVALAANLRNNESQCSMVGEQTAMTHASSSPSSAARELRFKIYVLLYVHAPATRCGCHARTSNVNYS